MIAFILHAANRNIKGHSPSELVAFYYIKDKILQRWGKVAGYDVQKIDGVRCRSCDGTGRYDRYSNYPPYKVYDSEPCWHCVSGWYWLPRWVCLQRIKLGPYEFHKPLKREEAIRNPFTKEELGWEVSERPVIKGYIDHKNHWFGDTAIALLFLCMDFKMFRFFINCWWSDRKRNFKWTWRKYTSIKTYIVKPKIIFHVHYLQSDGTWGDLPF